jgi:hypothetical protein
MTQTLLSYIAYNETSRSQLTLQWMALEDRKKTQMERAGTICK